MFRIAIIEDDRHCAERLLTYLEQYQKEKSVELSTQWFPSGLDFLSSDSSYDIVYMDISLPGMTGMEVARQLRQQDSVVTIMFVTELTHYAVKSYEVDALDYMVKPVPYAQFTMKLDRAIRKLQERDAWYMVTTKDGMVRLRISDIYFVESQDHYMAFYTTSGEYSVRATMKTVEEHLHHYHFSRPNKSYLINLKYVDVILRSSVQAHGMEFSISRTHKKRFMDDLTHYMGERIIHD